MGVINIWYYLIWQAKRWHINKGTVSSREKKMTGKNRNWIWQTVEKKIQLQGLSCKISIYLYVFFNLRGRHVLSIFNRATFCVCVGVCRQKVSQDTCHGLKGFGMFPRISQGSALTGRLSWFFETMTTSILLYVRWLFPDASQVRCPLLWTNNIHNFSSNIFEDNLT